MNRAIKSLVSQRFHKLKVIEFSGIDKKGNTSWLCECDCGKKTVARRQDLISGDKKSCGCLCLKDLTGQNFGKLLVIERAGTHRRGGATWLCQCSCGNQTVVLGSRLRNGETKSCGCHHIEAAIATHTKHGHTRGNCTKEYRAWESMKSRCCNPKNSKWDLYGGRGITVCPQWKDSFEKFLEDMGFAPSDKHSLDRFPDKDGNYEPGNCRWATIKQQNNNTSQNVNITFNGETKTLSSWAEQTGISRSAIEYRINAGWSIEKALTLPCTTKTIDIAKQKFGRLTVIEFVKNNNSKYAFWRCKCDCGNEAITSGRNLRSGRTRSCGCLQKEKVRKAARYRANRKASFSVLDSSSRDLPP